MSSVEVGLRDLIRALVREELAVLHGAVAYREPVQAVSPSSATPEVQPPLDKAVYTTEEVARILGCSPKAVYAKVSRGQLPGVFRVGRSLRFRGSELLLPFIRSRSKKTTKQEVKAYEVDIRFKWPDGEVYRERVRSPVSSKSGAKAWGEQRQAALLARGRQIHREVVKREVPTVEEFFPRFIEGYAMANRQKSSGVDSKESHFRNHLLPRFGTKRLDALTDEDVQQLKAALQERSVKTVNNCLSTLSMMLKMAVKWKVIDRMPVEIEHLKGADSTVEFYEVEEYERLLDAAGMLGPVQ